MRRVQDIKDINLIIKEMGMESSFIKMVDIMRDNGKIIKWMDLGDYTIKEVN